MWRFRWASLPKVAPHWVHLFSVLPVVEHTTVVPSCGIGDGGGWLLLGWGDAAGVVVVTAAAAIVAEVAADVVVVDDDVPGVLLMVLVVDAGGAALALALVSLVGVVMVGVCAHGFRPC